MEEANHLISGVKSTIVRLKESDSNAKKITNYFKEYGIDDNRYLEIQKEKIREIASDLIKDFK